MVKNEESNVLKTALKLTIKSFLKFLNIKAFPSDISSSVLGHAARAVLSFFFP